MLGKLLKYEFKSTVRTFGILYLALCVVAGLGALSFQFNEVSPTMIPVGLFLFIYTFLIGAVFFVTLYMIIQRFSRNLLQEQGYLMHTLPVHKWQLILSKLIAALCWMILSMIAITISGVVLSLSFFTVSDFFNDIREIIRSIPFLDAIQIKDVVYTIILELLSFIQGILMIYMSLAIGNLANKHKKLTAFAAFVVTIFVTDWIETIVSPNTRSVSSYTLQFFNINLAANQTFDVVFNLIWIVVFFAITEYILRKRLNLE
jgi:hypothetical protein